MKRNIQTTDCRHLRCRSVGFAARTLFACYQRDARIRQNQVSGFVIRMLLLLLMMTLEVGEMWGQSLPFEVTTDDDVTNHSEKFYWIESVGGKGFYIVPNSDNTCASTTNAPTLRALWYFMESGETNYYYIINKETGTYLKKTGNAGDNNTIQVAAYASADDDKFKFSFDTPQGITSGSWVIYPKDTGTNDQTGWVSKRSGNLQFGNGYWLKASNWNNTPVGDLNSQWKFVARNDVQWPQSGLPFVVSTSNDKHYYNINHVRSSTYNVSYDDNNYVTISTADDKKKVWYFLEAATDAQIDNLKYYYIVNAQTEKYLKFTATTINGSNQNDKFILSDYVAGDADRFQFVMVNSYDNQGNSWYSIMPKLAMSKYDVSNFANSMAPSSIANNEKLDLRSDRNTDKGHWVFVATDYVAVEAPTITNNFDGTISLSTATAGATIYYTTNGDTPDNTSTEYSTAFSLGDATVIKAIAYVGAVSSDVTTYDVPQCDTPTISFNSSTSLVTINSGSGATVRYTIDGGTPTTSSTAYSDPFSVTSNTVVKAIATHAGYLASETATQTIITEPSFQYKTGFSYVYDGTEKKPIDHLEYSSATIPSTAYLLTYTNNQNAGTATVTITDSGADDGFIVYGSTTFTIDPAVLTVTADAKSKGYGDADPELTYTTTGLKFEDTAAGVLSGALIRAAGNNVGTYAIEQGTLASNSNYTISYTGANFTITPKSLGSGTYVPANGISVDITKTDNGNDTYSFTPSISHNGTALTVGAGNDYTVTTTGDATTKYYEAIYQGVNNYTGTVKAKFVNVDFHPNSANTEWAASFVIGSTEGAFATPTGYTAHIVTGVTSGNVLTAPSLSYIPEDVPVILLSTASSNGFMAQPTSGAAPTVSENKLAVSTGTSFTAGQIYILYNGEFVLNAAGTLEAGKIYLPKSAIVSGSRPAPARLTINWSEATSIEDSHLSTLTSHPSGSWYTLDGRRLNGKPMKKGLYLRNGQKIVVR
ncbi:MAG: chitobiase/beta-hexosaminidase C-terminal domain-containing protein [Prevotella sp.]|nr:chitobiase/beta-hexosaminidase C-terminal domain-containing protein [Prevotella sp.]